jgi:hypothetical protein
MADLCLCVMSERSRAEVEVSVARRGCLLFLNHGAV